MTLFSVISKKGTEPTRRTLERRQGTVEALALATLLKVARTVRLAAETTAAAGDLGQLVDSLRGDA
jgi:hypothetical protein